MVHFGAVRLNNQLEKEKPLTLSAAAPATVKPQWEQRDLLTLGNQGKKLATVEQAKGSDTDVQFFQGKGGFAAIITTNDLRYIALPGSRIELPDTIVELPGQPVLASDTPAGPDAPPAPIQKVTEQAMILGAGLATRFEPVSGETTGFSKPGVPLAGEDSVIVNIARQMEKHGIKRILINTYFMPDSFKRELCEKLPNVHFIFINEDKPSGTAGGLVKGLGRVEVEERIPGKPMARKVYPNGVVDRKQPILILQGDAVTDADLSQLLNAHAEHGAKITLAVQNKGDYGLDKFAIVKTDRSGADGESGRILDYVEKPGKFFPEDPGRQEKMLKRVGDARLSSIGFYVLSPDVYTQFKRQGLQQLRQGNIFDYAMDFFPRLLGRKPMPIMWAEKLDGYWNDIGNPTDYLAVVKDIYAGKVKLALPKNLREYLANGAVFWPGTRRKAEAQGAKVSGNVIVANKPE